MENSRFILVMLLGFLGVVVLSLLFQSVMVMKFGVDSISECSHACTMHRGGRMTEYSKDGGCVCQYTKKEVK